MRNSENDVQTCAKRKRKKLIFLMDNSELLFNPNLVTSRIVNENTRCANATNDMQKCVKCKFKQSELRGGDG